jgi:transcriptional regulator GlxA family with amidase domain
MQITNDYPLLAGILIFDGMEVLDFAGPVEVFSSAWSDAGDMTSSKPLFRAITIAESNKDVTCFGGLVVRPHATINDHPPLDILVVPGGMVDDVVANPRILEWIVQQDKVTKLTTSVCTGAFVLAKCGLLRDHRATTHWSALDQLSKKYPEIDVIHDVRYVDEGHIITSAGISAGIDMSLHVVERLCDEKTAKEAAKGMEYRWESDP